MRERGLDRSRDRSSGDGRTESRAAKGSLRLVFLLVLVLALVATVASPPAASAIPASSLSLDALAESPRFLVLATHQATAERTLQKAERAFTLLQPHFAHPPGQVVTIAVIEDPKAYEEIQPAPMTRGFSTFGGTHVYLLADQLDQEVVTHELVHIFLGLNIRAQIDIPDWFNEGLAQYASGAQLDTMALVYYASAGDLLPLQQLDGVDALQSSNRQVATLEGLAVVRFLVDTYGEPKLWHLVGSFATAPSFNQAIQTTYGKTDLQLNEQWTTYARHNYSLLSPAMLRFAGMLALSLLAALAALVMLIRRLRRMAGAEGPSLSAAEIEAADLAERDARDDVDRPPRAS